jgi:hypothetical protein
VCCLEVGGQAWTRELRVVGRFREVRKRNPMLVGDGDGGAQEGGLWLRLDKGGDNNGYNRIGGAGNLHGGCRMRFPCAPES